MSVMLVCEFRSYHILTKKINLFDRSPHSVIFSPTHVLTFEITTQSINMFGSHFHKTHIILFIPFHSIRFIVLICAVLITLFLISYFIFYIFMYSNHKNINFIIENLLLSFSFFYFSCGLSRFVISCCTFCWVMMNCIVMLCGANTYKMVFVSRFIVPNTCTTLTIYVL